MCTLKELVEFIKKKYDKQNLYLVIYDGRTPRNSRLIYHGRLQEFFEYKLFEEYYDSKEYTVAQFEYVLRDNSFSVLMTRTNLVNPQRRRRNENVHNQRTQKT